MKKSTAFGRRLFEVGTLLAIVALIYSATNWQKQPVAAGVKPLSAEEKVRIEKFLDEAGQIATTLSEEAPKLVLQEMKKSTPAGTVRDLRSVYKDVKRIDQLSEELDELEKEASELEASAEHSCERQEAISGRQDEILAELEQIAIKLSEY